MSISHFKKIAVIGVSLIAVAFLFGCLDDPVSNDDSVEITITTFDSLTAGAIKSIEGEIKASPDIDESEITVAITKGGTDVISDFTIAKNDIEPSGTIDLKDDLGLKVTPKADIAGGDYVFALQVTAGTASSTKSVNFSIAGGNTTPITEHDATLGASASSNGSSLDADLGTAYTTTQLRGNSTLQATIDVYFAVTSSNQPKLGSPSWANTNGWGPESGGSWLSAPATEFMVAPTGTNYDNISSQEDIDALWSGTGASNLQVAANSLVLVKTTANTYGLIKVISAATNTSGDAVLKVKIKQ